MLLNNFRSYRLLALELRKAGHLQQAEYYAKVAMGYYEKLQKVSEINRTETVKLQLAA